MLLRFLLTILSFSHCYGAEGGRTFLIAAHLGDVAKMRYLLDHEGVDNLLKILTTLGDDTNIFVISHKGEVLDGKFNTKLEFKKDKNFSKMVA